MVDTWNSFAGVAPFDELKPVKEVHEPKSRRHTHLARGCAFVPGRRATGGRRRVRKGEVEEVPAQGPSARLGAKRSN